MSRAINYRSSATTEQLYLAVMLLLYVKQSFELIFFAMFAVVITHETSVCRPVDTSVCFLNSPISFRVASDWAGLLGREMLTQIPNGKCDTASNSHLGN